MRLTSKAETADTYGMLVNKAETAATDPRICLGVCGELNRMRFVLDSQPRVFCTSSGRRKTHTYVMSFIYTYPNPVQQNFLRLLEKKAVKEHHKHWLAFGCNTVKNKIENTNEYNNTILVTVYQKSMG